MAKRKKKKKSRLLPAFLAIIIVAGAFYFYNSNIVKKRFYPVKYIETVEKYTEMYNVDKSLVFAIIKAESNFNANAKSSKQAYGLMQITEDTMVWLKTKIDDEAISDITVDDLYIPEINIQLGTFLIKNNLDKYNDLKTALCAYNAGISRTDSWILDSRYSDDGLTISSAPFEETEQYSEKVMKYAKVYKQIYFS